MKRMILLAALAALSPGQTGAGTLSVTLNFAVAP